MKIPRDVADQLLRALRELNQIGVLINDKSESWRPLTMVCWHGCSALLRNTLQLGGWRIYADVDTWELKIEEECVQT